MIMLEIEFKKSLKRYLSAAFLLHSLMTHTVVTSTITIATPISENNAILARPSYPSLVVVDSEDDVVVVF